MAFLASDCASAYRTERTLAIVRPGTPTGARGRADQKNVNKRLIESIESTIQVINETSEGARPMPLSTRRATNRGNSRFSRILFEIG
jgi:hypothetical protein